MISAREISCMIFGMLFLIFLAEYIPEALGEESCESLAQKHPGVVIGAIKTAQRKVLEPSDGLPSWVPLDLVNRLHITTAEDVIRNELLFKEGEKLNPDLIEETRRNLRALDYFRDETMGCTLMDDGRVEVTVHVRETWSIVPIFDVQGVGGKQSITAGLRDGNLLGQGKSLSAAYRSGIHSGTTTIEESWKVSYDDPNILGSRFQMFWAVQDLETGEYVNSGVQRPFFSLETPWAAGLTQWHIEQKQRLVLDGEIAGEYDREDNEMDLHLGIALKRGPPAVHRVEALYQYRQKRIRNVKALLPSMDQDLIPEEYTISAPSLSYRRLGVKYIQETRIATFDRHEDFNIANDLTISTGFSAEALGATRDELILSAYDSQGYAFRRGHFVLGQCSLKGRWDGDELRDSKSVLVCDYFLRDTPLDFAPILHTFHGVLSFGYGVNLSSDTLFELGWDTGLRGYESASFTGHKLFRITAEDRIFPSRNIFGLVALGGVLFWDAGYVWDEDEKVDPGDVRHDVGVGLRIGIPTFSGENILRLDFGFPIGHAASLSEYLFTMVTSTTF